jgi:hypothetical protein
MPPSRRPPWRLGELASAAGPGRFFVADLEQQVGVNLEAGCFRARVPVLQIGVSVQRSVELSLGDGSAFQRLMG